ncbi:hypothetical protein JRO89_XS05G0151900 [Xanthoceras sorbifolium]|uniref:Protein FRA10AC1 n=1 Tax=Xanthoceras sorbifolium TaxID=99658 RepID=A0ABQ8I2L1_9ROSI|nr:hypothetical protein JRO89_XS05G0151900 [Xanthoceras sorbifolium]
MAAFGAIKSRIFDREERKRQYQAHIRGLNAYDRHKKFLNDYVAFYGKEKPTNTKLPVKTDLDTLREGYRFIRSEEDDKDFSWEQRLVKRYYDKLFKEYCIADMSHYKRGKIGLRWRTEKEVMSGKGQFICGNKHCDEKNGLASYEATGENKQALVKLVTCERCAEKLHYKRRKERELLESKEKEDYKRTREQSWSDDDDTDDECERRTGSERREKEVLKRNRDGSSDDNDRDEVYRGSQEKTKGKKASSSAANPNVDNNDDNFGEFLEGMFP